VADACAASSRTDVKPSRRLAEGWLQASKIYNGKNGLVYNQVF